MGKSIHLRLQYKFKCNFASYTMPDGFNFSRRRFKIKIHLVYTIVVLVMILLIIGWISVLVNDSVLDNRVDQVKPLPSSLKTRTFLNQVSITRTVAVTKNVVTEIQNATKVPNPEFEVDTLFHYSNQVYPVLLEADVNETQHLLTNLSGLNTNKTEVHRTSTDLEIPDVDIFERNSTWSKPTTSEHTSINSFGAFETVMEHNHFREKDNINFTIMALSTAEFNNNVDFDISDLDDHIYLIENQEFKQSLENGIELDFMHKRMWKEKNVLNSTYTDRKQVFNMYYKAIRNQGRVNCNNILDNNKEGIESARDFMSNHVRKDIKTEYYVQMKDCENFRNDRGYIENSLSESERKFPLAFGIIMYRDVEQTERLLRAIYRPHNHYCIHVDRKSDKSIRLAVENIARCFPNVLIASKLENVTWGEFTVLQADLNCMEELFRHTSWRYYINLTGQEFPLKTNREIVEILKAMDGANIVDGTWVRANEKHFYRWTSAGKRPPHGIRPIKGSVHVLVNRHFVDFCLHDTRARDFLAWLQKTQIPDETYYASLNHNPHLGIKGSFLGEPEAYPLKPAFMRYKNWEYGHSSSSRPCTGKYVRHICILGVGDLHSAYSDTALFVNKFHLDYEYLALDCLEEVLHEKTWQQYLEDTPVDVSYYKKLDYVKYKLT